MYPHGILAWLGYLAIVFGVLVLVGVVAWRIHHHWDDRHED